MKLLKCIPPCVLSGRLAAEDLNFVVSTAAHECSKSVNGMFVYMLQSPEIPIARFRTPGITSHPHQKDNMNLVNPIPIAAKLIVEILLKISSVSRTVGLV